MSPGLMGVVTRKEGGREEIKEGGGGGRRGKWSNLGQSTKSFLMLTSNTQAGALKASLQGEEHRLT
jgi:hypothetical protein